MHINFDTCVDWQSDTPPPLPPGYHFASDDERKRLPQGALLLYREERCSFRCGQFGTTFAWLPIGSGEPASESFKYACPDIPLVVFRLLHQWALKIESIQKKLPSLKASPQHTETLIAIREAQRQLASRVQGRVYAFLNELGCAPDASAFRKALSGELDSQCIPSSAALMTAIEYITMRLKAQIEEVDMQIRSLRQNRFPIHHLLLWLNLLPTPSSELKMIKRREALIVLLNAPSMDIQNEQMPDISSIISAVA